MKLFRPLRGEVLFTCPAVSIQKYESQWMKPWMWVVVATVNIVLMGAVWMLLFHLDWSAFVHLTGAFAIFAIIIIPVVMAFKEKYPDPRLHSFYRDSVYVYTGIPRRNHGSYSNIFPDMVNRITMREVEYEDDRFRFFTVSLKDIFPGILPNYQKIKFGIPMDADLGAMEDWLRDHGLTVESESA
jgi:hypothetical protein